MLRFAPRLVLPAFSDVSWRFHFRPGYFGRELVIRLLLARLLFTTVPNTFHVRLQLSIDDLGPILNE
jgi:hypothetical protein